MKDGLRFVDSDMHIQEPGDLLKKYLDPEFKKRVTWAVDGKGKISRRTWTIDGLPTGADSEMQQHRKRAASSKATGPVIGAATGVLSASRIADTGRMDFAIERGYDEEAQVMGMEMEGIDIAVLFPTGGLGLLARDNMDPRHFAGPEPGLQQLDPRLLPVQPGAHEVRRHAAAARREPGVPRAEAGGGGARGGGLVHPAQPG